MADITPSTTRVVRAITNAGNHPAYHQRQLNRLRLEWPTLYYALMDLVGEAGPYGRYPRSK